MLYPLLAQVALTFGVFLVLARRRVSAAKSGETDWAYFKTFIGSGEPTHVQQAARNFNNLFEVPTLFFAAGLAAQLFDRVDQISLALAWGYVALRFVHSYVHLGRNNVITRFKLFLISNLVLFVFWVWIAL